MARASFCVMLATLAIAASVTSFSTANAWNAGSNGTMAIGASAFNKVFTATIPIIKAVGPSIAIGPFSGKHYDVGVFNLQKLAIGAIDISFVNPNQLKATITGLDIAVSNVEFEVKDKIFFSEFHIHCHGQFSGGASGDSATVDIALSTDARGKLAATVATPVVSIGTPNIDIHMHSFCKIAGGIIDLFKKLIEKELKKEVDKLLPTKIETIFQELLTKDLPKLPLHFASQPMVVSDHMELDVQLLAPSGPGQLAGGALVSQNVGPLVQPHIFLDRDISIGISTRSFDDLIASLAAKNGFDFHHSFSGKVNTSIFKLLVPGVYAKCPDCPFGINVAILPYAPPTAGFGSQAMEFNFNSILMNFTAQPATGDAEESLFSALTNLSFGFTNFTVADTGVDTLVKFDIALNDFSMHLQQSAVGHIDLTKFSAFVDGVFKDLVVPLFNSGFHGFPLDLVKDGFGLDQWKVDLKQDAITLGSNLLLPNQAGIIKAALRGKL